MGLPELFLLAIGLSMDAFAVSVGKGLSMKKVTAKKCGIVGLYFGLFQAGMPVIGYCLGVQFQDKITSIDHWISLVLLVLIGISMIKESIQKEEESTKETEDTLKVSEMLTLAIATSIDALAVGVTFAFLHVDLLWAVSFIGIVTFIISACGVVIGHFFGSKYKKSAEMAGGLILIFIGLKIVTEHLFF